MEEFEKELTRVHSAIKDGRTSNEFLQFLSVGWSTSPSGLKLLFIIISDDNVIVNKVREFVDKLVPDGNYIWRNRSRPI